MKRILTILFAVMAVGQVWAATNDTYDFSAVCSSGQTLYYKISSDTEPYTVAIVAPINSNSSNAGWGNLTKPSGNLVIPEKVMYNNIEYTVTFIGAYAFNLCKDITSISVPNTIQGIDYMALQSDNSSLIIDNENMNEYGNALYLGNAENPYVILIKKVNTGKPCEVSNGCQCVYMNAFSGSGNYNEYDNVNYYGTSTNPYLCLVQAKYSGIIFNRSIQSCEIHKDCKYIVGAAGGATIGCGALNNCPALRSVIIPEGVVSIGVDALAHTDLDFVTIPKSVTNICCWGLKKDHSEDNMDLAPIILVPKNVTNVGFYGFTGWKVYCEAASMPNNWSDDTRAKLFIFDCKVIRLISDGVNNGELAIDGNYDKKGTDGSLWYIPTSENPQVTLTAKPNTGYHVKWQDGNMENNRTLPVTESKTYSATFETHSETYKFENINPATCTTAGSYDSVVYCSICNEELYRETIATSATGHDWGTPTYTWSEDGSSCKATAVCQRDETHVETEDATITSEETVAPTCEEMGTTTYTATFENELFAPQTKDVVDVPTNGHTYSNTVTSPTCTAVGYTTHTCSVCEYAYNSDTVSANGHTPDSIVFENIIAATCTAAGSYDSVVYCSVCQAEQFREGKAVAALGHTYSNNVTSPTCINVGYTTHVCSVCNHTYNSDTVAANGHTEVVDAAIAATCTTAGKTEGKHCSVCNEVIVAQTEVAALGHNYGEYVYNSDATTDADGTKTATCSRCGEKDTQVAEGTKLVRIPENDGTAVSESAANEINIYAHGNRIVVENATDEIRVFDAMGALIRRDAKHRVRAEIPVTATGVYIVKTGSVVKRVVINEQ